MRMSKALRIVVLAAIVGVALGVEAFAGATNTNAVVFDVKVVTGGSRWGPPQTTWLATYPPTPKGSGVAGKKDGKTAEFRISLPHQALGSGKFSREPSSREATPGQGEKSDTSVLLRDLGKALRGKVPEKVDQVDELTVTFYVLGDKMTKTEKGSFKGGGQGDWLLVKMFVFHDEAEFYLNINEKTGKGEFALKDPDYGDRVLKELAKVFAPSADASGSEAKP